MRILARVIDILFQEYTIGLFKKENTPYVDVTGSTTPILTMSECNALLLQLK
jgi:hypothetical protein